MRKTGIELVVAVLSILGAAALFRGLVVPVVEGVFDLGPDAVSAVRRVGIFGSVLAAYVGASRLHQRRATPELRIRPLATIAGAGAAMISISTLALFGLGAYQVTEVRGLSPALLGVAAVLVVAAFLEEVVFRGVVFRLVEQGFGTRIALEVQAVLFGLVHVTNVDGTLDAVVTMVSVTLLGAMWALIYATTRNLWVVTAHHAAWNFAIVLTGVPLSGSGDWLDVGPLRSRYAGPDWLTGGEFGPENSVICLAVVVGSVAALWRSAHRAPGDR